MEDATPCHISLLISSDIPIIYFTRLFGFAGMQIDVFMMFDCLRRCIKERTPLPYINVGAMNRVNPPLIFVSFNIFFLFFFSSP